MSTLSDVDAQWFSIKFNSMAARSGGTEYQALFVGIMEALHPGDFESVRPYGNKGDLKCDGLHRSTGTVFQVYAPRATKLAAMLSKIRADFEGARKHWAAEMKRWVFVYNDHEGLPADILKLLEKYRDDTGSLSRRGGRIDSSRRCCGCPAWPS